VVVLVAVVVVMVVVGGDGRGDGGGGAASNTDPSRRQTPTYPKELRIMERQTLALAEPTTIALRITLYPPSNNKAND
jgi:hypothetical protein